MAPFARRLQRTLHTSSTGSGGTVPTSPLNVSAIAGSSVAYVYFDPPASSGGSAIITYVAKSAPGNITANGASPITVSGLVNGTSYTFTVHATNSGGNSPESAASNAVTPATISQPSVLTLSTNTVQSGV